MAAFAGKAIQTQRKGGKYEAVGFGLIIIGIGLFSAAATLNIDGSAALGSFFFIGGFIVFLIGRFM